MFNGLYEDARTIVWLIISILVVEIIEVIILLLRG